jgi:hypothetical protein
MTHTDKFLWLRTEYDSYKEWFDTIGFPQLSSSKKWANENNDFSNSEYYFIKEELENVFKDRKIITQEELHQYVKSIIKSKKRSVFIYLLIIYEDFYHSDKNYQKELWFDTVKDFEITKEEMKGARNGWEPKWVKNNI